jgi:hypothetical protein
MKTNFENTKDKYKFRKELIHLLSSRHLTTS